VAVFWNGAPPIFAFGGILLGYVARERAASGVATAAIGIGVLAVVRRLRHLYRRPSLSRMFVSVTTVEGENRPIEEVTMIGEEMQTWLRDVEGFEGIMILLGNGTALGLTFWASEEAAERARPMRIEFLERVTSVANVSIRAIDGYEVAFAGLGPNVAGRAG
jgi:hypothetical protein